MDNADSNIFSRAGDTPQNIRTAEMTSNAESEVLSTDQGSYTMYVHRIYTIVLVL